MSYLSLSRRVRSLLGGLIVIVFCSARLGMAPAHGAQEIAALQAAQKQPAASTAKSLGRPAAASKPGWSLLFADEFDADSLSAGDSPWITGYPFGQSLGNELEYYTRFDKNFTTSCDKGGQNHIFSSGSLKLRAKKEPGSYALHDWLPANCTPYEYTSGMIFSKQEYRYGYFEIRAKMPLQGRTLWPAFWLNNSVAAQYREIDVFEFNGPVANRMGTNVHLARQVDGGVTFPAGNTEPLNDYQWTYDMTNPPDVTDQFHTYAVEWTPNSIRWYVDDNVVRTLAGHSPHLPMNVIANLAIDLWEPDKTALTQVAFPQDFEIDYIRIYKSLRNEFISHWGNEGSGKLKVWNLNANDKYVVGDFDGDGKDELLATNANGWHHTMRFAAGDWAYTEGGGNGKIAAWNMSANDRYISAKFEGNGKASLLAVNPNGWHHTMKFDGANWQYIEGGNNGKINWWNIDAADQYVAGDFDGDGKAELLAISPNGAHHTMRFLAGTWQTVEGGGNGKIDAWNIAGGDKYVVGDFDGDGKDDLLAISSNGWHHTMRFDGANWHYVEGGSGGKIGLWNIAATDQFRAARFQGNNHDQVVAVSKTGWSHLVAFTGSGWNTEWGNDGANSIDLWRMRPTDTYVAGKFDPLGGAELLSVSAVNGWSQMMKYTNDY
jgi:beta-glucanase (GH16 family)